MVAPGEANGWAASNLEAPARAPEGSVLEDIEAFARELAERAGDGLGWS